MTAAPDSGRAPRSTSDVTDPTPTAPTTSSAKDLPARDVTAPTDRREIVAAQKSRYGGVKWGSAFFGWLTATGTALLLTAVAAAAGAAVGLANPAGPRQAVSEAAQDPDTMRTVGVTGGIVLLVILLVAYYCGGYVAGRMARFHGARQGVAVWVWAVAIAAVAAIVGAVAGAQFDVLANLNGLPRLPINEGELTTGGILAAGLALVVALGGAVLGGLAGMRFHRRVDRDRFEDDTTG